MVLQFNWTYFDQIKKGGAGIRSDGKEKGFNAYPFGWKCLGLRKVFIDSVLLFGQSIFGIKVILKYFN